MPGLQSQPDRTFPAWACRLGAVALIIGLQASAAEGQSPTPSAACYVPLTGNMYVIGVPDAPATCRPGHRQFSLVALPLARTLSSGSPLLSLTNTGGKAAHFESKSTSPSGAIVAYSVDQYHTAGFFNTGTIGGAVYGESKHSGATALFLNTGSGPALHAEGIVAAVLKGNVQITGTLTVNGTRIATADLPSRAPTGIPVSLQDGEWVTEYGEDVLASDSVWVTLPPAVTAHGASRPSYHIFLQLYGRGNAYVARRTASGFLVRCDGCAAGTEFSYRVAGRAPMTGGTSLAAAERP